MPTVPPAITSAEPCGPKATRPSSAAKVRTNCFAGYDFSSQAVLAGGQSGMAKYAEDVRPLIQTKDRDRTPHRRDFAVARTAQPHSRVSAASDRLCRGEVRLSPHDHRTGIDSEISGRDPYREFFRQFDYRKTSWDGNRRSRSCICG